MLINLKIKNFGPFKDEVELDFEATKDTHLEPHYVRELTFLDGVKKIRVLRMAMIYGPNGAGKSTVLNALSLLDDLVTRPARENDELLEDVNTFQFQPQAASIPTELTAEYFCKGVVYQYRLELLPTHVVAEQLSYKKSPQGKWFDLYQRHTVERDGMFELVVKFDARAKATTVEQETIMSKLLPNTTILSIIGKKMTTKSEALNQAYLWFKDQLLGEVTPKTRLSDWATRLLDNGQINKQQMLSYMNQAGIAVTDIDIEQKKLTSTELKMLDRISDDEHREEMVQFFSKQKICKTVYQVDGQSYPLLLNQQESLGTQRYFGLSALLSKICPSALEDTVDSNHCQILPIDEIEHSLHPELIEHFLVTFLKDKGNSQLISTTHYRELLDNELLFRRDVIWFVDKNQQTLSSGLYALSEITVEGYRSSSSTFNFYKQGRFGAVPDLMGGMDGA